MTKIHTELTSSNRLFDKTHANWILCKLNRSFRLPLESELSEKGSAQVQSSDSQSDHKTDYGQQYQQYHKSKERLFAQDRVEIWQLAGPTWVELVF
jgi:hypothetical protein